MAKERIGVIGPGRMGLAMVKRLVGNGCPANVADFEAEQPKRAAGDFPAGQDRAPI